MSTEREKVPISAEHKIQPEQIDPNLRCTDSGVWVANFPIAGTQEVRFITVNGVECLACPHPEGRGFIFVTYSWSHITRQKEVDNPYAGQHSSGTNHRRFPD